MLGLRVCGYQVALKVFSSRKTSRKVRAVEVPVGGSKRENSLGALKWAIHVQTSLNGLFKLIKGTFHLLGLGLSDLKGDCGSIFVLLVWPGFWCFYPLTNHSARGRNFGRRGGKLTKGVQWAYIKLGLRLCGSQGRGRPRKNQSCCAPLA